MAQIQIIQKEGAIEKPISAAAVMATLMAVILPVPHRLVSRSLIRLERMVPTLISMDTMPA